jgi:hypothetical protein
VRVSCVRACPLAAKEQLMADPSHDRAEPGCRRTAAALASHASSRAATESQCTFSVCVELNLKAFVSNAFTHHQVIGRDCHEAS